MPSLVLLGLTFVVTLIHLLVRWQWHNFFVVFLSYLIFFNIGIMGIFGFSVHVLMADEVAKMIGWAPGSPFQFEVAVANLAFGVLGILSLWLRGLFWVATVIGTSVFFLGCFVGHLYQFIAHGNVAPYNIGPSIWLSDLFLPIVFLVLVNHYYRNYINQPTTNSQ